MQDITFEKANFLHRELIFSWLSNEHVKEFWDSSQDHKDDIINFMEGRKNPSRYCGGHYVYWIGSIMNVPYSMIMSIEEKNTGEINQLKIDNLSKHGNTYSIDYMIGAEKFIGKGLGGSTLSKFISFFVKNFDERAVRFLIDPACNNPRAKHVYEKAGFKHVGDFVMEGNSSGSGMKHHLLVFDVKDRL